MKKQFEFLIMQFAVLLAGLLPYCAFAQNRPHFTKRFLLLKHRIVYPFQHPDKLFLLGALLLQGGEMWRNIFHVNRF